MAATTLPTDDPDETTVISTPTPDQLLRRGTRHRLPSFKLRDSGDNLLTALLPDTLNLAGQHVTDDHLQMHWATVLLAEAPGLPRESTASVMTLLQHGPTETDIESNSNATPKTMKEALNSPKNKEWKAAIKKEYEGIRDRNVFRVVPIPAGKRVLSTKWDFTIKKNKDGSIRKYKARWVVRGFAQREGEDFDKSKLYAPVVSFSSVRTALAMAAQWKWPIYQLDVVAAFLGAVVMSSIFLETISPSLRAFLIAIMLDASCGPLSAPAETLRLQFHACADSSPSRSFATGQLLNASSVTLAELQTGTLLLFRSRLSLGVQLSNRWLLSLPAQPLFSVTISAPSRTSPEVVHLGKPDTSLSSTICRGTWLPSILFGWFTSQLLTIVPTSSRNLFLQLQPTAWCPDS